MHYNREKNNLLVDEVNQMRQCQNTRHLLFLDSVHQSSKPQPLHMRTLARRQSAADQAADLLTLALPRAGRSRVITRPMTLLNVSSRLFIILHAISLRFVTVQWTDLATA
jgi:hypothetical protein